MSSSLPPIENLKLQAKALRRALEAQGRAVTHSQSLELIAHQFGARDWNTLHARAGNLPDIPFAVGQRVKGLYLGQPFAGEVVGLTAFDGRTRFEIELRFDDPVDVIRFAGMSNFRRRVRATIDRSGTSAARTSDGAPHLSVAAA